MSRLVGTDGPVQRGRAVHAGGVDVAGRRPVEHGSHTGEISARGGLDKSDLWFRRQPGERLEAATGHDDDHAKDDDVFRDHVSCSEAFRRCPRTISDG